MFEFCSILESLKLQAILAQHVRRPFLTGYSQTTIHASTESETVQ